MLDTYQAERKPHARALIRLAKLVGTAMTDGGELGNLLRRLRRAATAPHARRSSGTSWTAETPPLRRCDLVARPRLRRSLAGRLCPNAVLDDGRRFDDVAAGRFAVVTTTAADPGHSSADIDAARRPSSSPPHPAPSCTAGCAADAPRAAIVRPDGTVLRAGRDLSALCAALPHFTPDHRHGTADVVPASVPPVSR